MSKIRVNPYFPPTQKELANALGQYWRELATKVNATATATINNTDNAIGSLVIGLVYSQAEVQALRDKCEELADDVRTLKAALVTLGLLE